VLTQKIATDNLADAFMAFNTNYHDTGLFGVYAVTDRERSNDLSWVVMNEVRHECMHACLQPQPLVCCTCVAAACAQPAPLSPLTSWLAVWLSVWLAFFGWLLAF
jgi:hypothetical protein